MAMPVINNGYCWPVFRSSEIVTKWHRRDRMKFWEKKIIILVIGFLFQGSLYAEVLPSTSQVYVKSIYSLPLSLDPIQMKVRAK